MLRSNAARRVVAVQAEVQYQATPRSLRQYVRVSRLARSGRAALLRVTFPRWPMPDETDRSARAWCTARSGTRATTWRTPRPRRGKLAVPHLNRGTAVPGRRRPRGAHGAVARHAVLGRRRLEGRRAVARHARPQLVRRDGRPARPADRPGSWPGGPAGQRAAGQRTPTVVIFGNSAGGQYVNRYAAVGRGPARLAGRGIDGALRHLQPVHVPVLHPGPAGEAAGVRRRPLALRVRGRSRLRRGRCRG